MSHSSSARWLAVFPVAVAFATAATLGATAVAQPVSMPAHDGSGSAGQPAASSVALHYHSALEGYRPLADEKAIPWKGANDTVYRRGGWQAYAKESAGPRTVESASSADSHAPTGAQPGHGMPMSAMPGMAGAPATKDTP